MAEFSITAEQSLTDAKTASQVFGLGYAEVDPIDGEHQGPGDLRRYLAELRLLQHIPFSYLVPDANLLPMESIRFFYVDRNWTDAAVQGSLSVGTITTADRTQLETGYPVLREEIDETERTIRDGSEPGPLSGEGGTITGFLLRSKAVSGWPNLHVRAYAGDSVADDELTDIAEDDPSRMKILRLERLAPAVLFVLIDGVPELIHIEEPRQGIQFGIRYDPASPPEARKAVIPARNVATGADIGTDVTVPFRPGSPGVLDLPRLRSRLAAVTPDRDDFEPNELALQLLRFPFRQIFGDLADDVNENFYDLGQFQVSLSLDQWHSELSQYLERVEPDAGRDGEEGPHGS